MTTDRFLRDKDVAALLGCSRQHVWHLSRMGVIPQPIKLTAGMTRWRELQLRHALEQQSGAEG